MAEETDSEFGNGAMLMISTSVIAHARRQAPLNSAVSALIQACIDGDNGSLS